MIIKKGYFTIRFCNVVSFLTHWTWNVLNKSGWNNTAVQCQFSLCKYNNCSVVTIVFINIKLFSNLNPSF